ncbi:growth-regulating factor 8 [Actinidia rufa]|uniref:Growth-regulating factor n=1 Tax=Actinidia rufa TaxID=165716 RepID=A0A7J0DXM7_9ERIC|nr:growth-regulating factor 8 [Actinidia rufa]
MNMGSGNRSGLVDGTDEAASPECDVGLGLRMQGTESFPSKRMMMAMPHHHPHHHHHVNPCSESSMGGGGGVCSGGGDGGSGGGGPIYCNLSNQQLASLSDIYDAIGAGSVSGAPRTLHPYSTSDSSFKSSGGNMPAAAAAKVAFTASQWQELERQTAIYKYMMASLPVPPELLIPISKSPSPLPSSQSNMFGVDLRFSRGSDLEPWRCRRTDGKKWRCSRDVTPNQKYCERHAHKTRSRSRKPVELASHNTNTSTSTKTNNSMNTHHPLVDLPANATAQPFQKPIFHIPSMVSASTYAQPRCTEWFMKGDPIPGSTSNQQWQQLMQSSSREGLNEGLKRYSEENYRSGSFFQQHYGEQHESMDTNSYFDMDDGQRFQNQQPSDQYGSVRGPKVGCLQGGINADQTQTTRRFIDAWSSAEQEEMDEFSNKYSGSSSGKLPLSSLTLSMSGGDGMDEEMVNSQTGLGMMDPERETGGGFKSQWLNPVSWMGSPPGGPLGEALCLGIAGTAKEASNVPSPHGYSNSTTTSGCSKSSCEDSGHGLHFH